MQHIETLVNTGETSWDGHVPIRMEVHKTAIA